MADSKADPAEASTTKDTVTTPPSKVADTVNTAEDSDPDFDDLDGERSL